MADITDSLGRKWDPAKHPRDRKGRFIRTFHKVRLFNVGGTRPWGVGTVSSIDGPDNIGVDVTALARGNPESAEHKVGEHFTAKASNLESVNEKASLNTTPDAAPNADELASLDFDNPNSQYERLSISLANSRRNNDPDSFIAALEKAGADPDATDPNAPDGLPALQPFLDEYNDANPLPNGYEEVLPETKDREFKSSEDRPRKGLSINSANTGPDYFQSEDDGENWDIDDATDFEELLGGEEEDSKATLNPTDETPVPGSSEDDFLAELESIYEDDETVLEDGDTQELHNKYTVSRDGNKVSVAAPDGEVVATLPASTDQEHLDAAASQIFNHYDENYNSTDAPEEPKADLTPEADAPTEPTPEQPEPSTELTSEELDKLEILRDRAADTERDLFSIKPDEMDSLSIQKLADEGYITITEPGPNGNRTGRIQPKGHDALDNSGRGEIAPAPETAPEAPAEPKSVQERLDALSPESKDFLVGDDFVETGSVHEDQIPGPVTGDLLDAEFIEKDSNDTYRLTDDGQTAMELELAKDFNPDEDGLADAPTPDSEEADNHETDSAEISNELTPEEEDYLTSGFTDGSTQTDPIPEAVESLEEKGLIDIDRRGKTDDEEYTEWSATATDAGEEKKREMESRDAESTPDEPNDGPSEPDGGTDPIDDAQKSYDEATTPEEKQEAATEALDRIVSDVFEPVYDENGNPVLDDQRNPVRVPTGEQRIETKEEYIERYKKTNQETTTAKWFSDEREFPEIGNWLLEGDTNPKDSRLNPFLKDEDGQPYRFFERGIFKGRKVRKGNKIAFKFKTSKKGREGIVIGTVTGFFGSRAKGGKIGVRWTDDDGKVRVSEIDYDNLYNPEGIDIPEGGVHADPEIHPPAGTTQRQALQHFLDSWFGSDNQDRLSRLTGREKFILENGYVLQARNGGEPPYLSLIAPDGRVVDDFIEVPGHQYGTVSSKVDSAPANPQHRFDDENGFLDGIETKISDDEANPQPSVRKNPEPPAAPSAPQAPAPAPASVPNPDSGIPAQNPARAYYREISGPEKMRGGEALSRLTPASSDDDVDDVLREISILDHTVTDLNVETALKVTGIRSGRDLDEINSRYEAISGERFEGGAGPDGPTSSGSRDIDAVVPDPGDIGPKPPKPFLPSPAATAEERQNYRDKVRAFQEWSRKRLAQHWRERAIDNESVFAPGPTIPENDPESSAKGANKWDAINRWNNCYNCVTAFALRMKGYDVVANSSTDTNGRGLNNLEILLRWWGTSRKNVNTHQGRRTRKHDLFERDFKAELVDLYGPNTYGGISQINTGKGASGHVFVWYIDGDGEVHFYEPQRGWEYESSGNGPTSRTWIDTTAPNEPLETFRLDNLPLPTGEGVISNVPTTGAPAGGGGAGV